MKESIQDKINAIKKLAKDSGASPYVKAKSTMSHQDSLSKAITNQKQADAFLAELEIAIKLAHQK